MHRIIIESLVIISLVWVTSSSYNILSADTNLYDPISYKIDLETFNVQPQYFPRFPSKSDNYTLHFVDFPTNPATGSFYGSATYYYTGDVFFIEVSLNSNGTILRKQRISQFPCFVREVPRSYVWDSSENRLIAITRNFFLGISQLVTVTFNNIEDNCRILANISDYSIYQIQSLSIGRFFNEKKYFYTSIWGISPEIYYVDDKTGKVGVFKSEKNDLIVGWKAIENSMYAVILDLGSFFHHLPVNFSLMVDVNNSGWKRLREYDMKNFKECENSGSVYSQIYSYGDSARTFVVGRNLIMFVTCGYLSDKIMALSVHLDTFELKLIPLNLEKRQSDLYIFTDLTNNN